MEYNFSKIEAEAREFWNKEQVYKVTNDTTKPKYYVLDMFPYPSGAGLHVGHPLGYIASDIYARYKRLCGYNVLHPMGFDAFGLPAEQYALETGQHPSVTTEKNTKRYREQLDNIGFCYDWSREVRTSDPKYYKWTQWIFLQLFHSWYNRKVGKACPISELIHIFETEGNTNHACPGNEATQFDATTWQAHNEIEKRAILMQYRLAYQGYAQVWWCEALGTVLANDEVVNGVSERGGHPVERKNMRQWFLRITEYADRLLTSLDNLEWSEAMKEMQRNWIGKSTGALVKFNLLSDLSQALSKGEEGVGQAHPDTKDKLPGWNTADPILYSQLNVRKEELKANETEAERVLWSQLKGSSLGAKFRRQHIVDRYIADFICLSANLIIEVDGKFHLNQKDKDDNRTSRLNELGYKVIRFSNDEVIANTDGVLSKIKKELELSADTIAQSAQQATSPSLGGGRGEVSVFTTRPDTIFGVDFLVLAPEHELVASITTAEQKEAVNQYVQYVKSRSERERQAEVKTVTGCFTGAFAVHPLNNNLVPVWISEYVLAGYGTGAIMGVPSGDERDHRFAQHFKIPITNIFGDKYNGEEAIADKLVTIYNSGFVSGMSVPEAAKAIIDALEKLEAGTRKVNYRLRDAGFSRQRYWGEPFPIVYVNGIPYGNDEMPEETPADVTKLPVELPHVENYKPGPEGQGPLANVEDWVCVEGGERETNTMPGYAGSSWYFLRSMDPHNDGEFASRAATDYWKQVDLYVGGTEHAVGHLLYSRMWTKALCDLGHISFDEPFRRLLNQGMIQGSSRFAYRLNGRAAETIVAKILRTEFKELNILLEHKIGEQVHDFVSEDHKLIIEITGQKVAPNKYKNMVAEAPGYCCITISNEEIFSKLATGCRRNQPLEDISSLLRTLIKKRENYYTAFKLQEIWYVSYKWKQFLDKEIGSDNALSAVHVDVSIVDGVTLNLENYKNWRPEYADAEFILEDGEYICGAEVEKMSKSKYNVVNPDDIVAQYGADTFRMYEMFLGPIDVSKPWDTKGIEGVYRFLKKLWRLYADEQKGWIVTDDAATDAELRILHKTIKKIGEDMERFSFNTSVSQLMITVNDLTAAGCHKRAILEPLAIVICPFAPHLAEELWKQLGHITSAVAASFPAWEERYVTENSKKYPVALNGKTKFDMEFPLDAEKDYVQQQVLGHEIMQKLLDGKTPKNFIFVKGKMINVVV